MLPGVAAGPVQRAGPRPLRDQPRNRPAPGAGHPRDLPVGELPIPPFSRNAGRPLRRRAKRSPRSGPLPRRSPDRADAHQRRLLIQRRCTTLAVMSRPPSDTKKAITSATSAGEAMWMSSLLFAQLPRPRKSPSPCPPRLSCVEHADGGVRGRQVRLDRSSRSPRRSDVLDHIISALSTIRPVRLGRPGIPLVFQR
jgi:hypothetical protein